MKRISVLAAGFILYAMAAHAGLMLGNSAGSGDAGSAVVQTIKLADGSALTVSPTR
jgi:hypothetical protein